MNTNQLERVVSSLTNDENSTDEELLTFFVDVVGITREEALPHLAKRNFYLNNIVDPVGNLLPPGEHLPT